MLSCFMKLQTNDYLYLTFLCFDLQLSIKWCALRYDVDDMKLSNDMIPFQIKSNK